MATIEQALQETGHAFTQRDNTTVEVRTVRLSQDWKTYGQPIVDLVILADGQRPSGSTGTLAEVWQHRHARRGLAAPARSPRSGSTCAVGPRGKMTSRQMHWNGKPLSHAEQSPLRSDRATSPSVKRGRRKEYPS